MTRLWLTRVLRFNPLAKLNLNFVADLPPLPEGITEEMIEDYECEDDLAAAEGAGLTENTTPADSFAVVNDGAAA